MDNYINEYCAGCFWADLCSAADMEKALNEGCDHLDTGTMDSSLEELMQWRDELVDFQGEWQEYIECHEDPQENAMF